MFTNLIQMREMPSTYWTFFLALFPLRIGLPTLCTLLTMLGTASWPWMRMAE